MEEMREQTRLADDFNNPGRGNPMMHRASMYICVYPVAYSRHSQIGCDDGFQPPAFRLPGLVPDNQPQYISVFGRVVIGGADPQPRALIRIGTVVPLSYLAR